MVQTVADDRNGGMWFGTGYLVAKDLVLTVGHVLQGADRVAVRFVDAPGRVRKIPARAVFADARADVALLRLEQAEPQVTAVMFGYPAGPVGCDAVGFPRFKLKDNYHAAGAQSTGGARAQRGLYRDSHHTAGACHPDSNRYAGTLELNVQPPGHDPDPARSPWEGMSGAPVFAADYLIAVVNEHHRRDGLGRLTASRVDRWYDLIAPLKLAELAVLIGLPSSAAGLHAVRPGDDTEALRRNSGGRVSTEGAGSVTVVHNHGIISTGANATNEIRRGGA